MNVPITVNDYPWIAAWVSFISLILLMSIAYWTFSASDTPVRFRSWLPSWLRVSLKALSVAAGVAFIASVLILVHHVDTENAAAREREAAWRTSVQAQIEQSLIEQYAISEVKVDDARLQGYVRPISDLRVPAVEPERKWSVAFTKDVLRNDPFSAPSVRVATEDHSVREFGVVFDETTGVATLIGISGEPSPGELLREASPANDDEDMTLLERGQQ